MAASYDGGVVMGADSRTSTGAYVANRVTDKITSLAENIYICRSGSAADTQNLSRYVQYFIEQHRMELGEDPQVKTAAMLAQSMAYQNKVGWSEKKQNVEYVRGRSSVYYLPFAHCDTCLCLVISEILISLGLASSACSIWAPACRICCKRVSSWLGGTGTRAGRCMPFLSAALWSRHPFQSAGQAAHTSTASATDFGRCGPGLDCSLSPVPLLLERL